MAAEAFETEVQRHLKEKGPATALELSRELGCTRVEANRALYNLLKSNAVRRNNTSPPSWLASEVPPHVPGSSSVDLEELRRLVVVDLGNTHDCLQELLPYAREGHLEVMAYADLAFNGFGVKPPLSDAPGVTVKQATTADKNAADVDMIWDLATLLNQNDPKYFVVVATKDLSFRRLKALAENHGHRLEFVTGWRELRHYVE